jgi:deuterolysin
MHPETNLGRTDFNYAVIQEARSNCHHLALGAAAAAAGGDIRLETLFKSLSISVRNEVSARMSAVARTCGTEWPSTIFNCNDALGFCTNSIPAYYSAQVNPMTYCPPFFNRIKPVSREYLGFDQGTSILHETTHVPGVYSPPTQDLAYTYTYSAKLSTGEALRNADSYTVFAQCKFISQVCLI